MKIILLSRFSQKVGSRQLCLTKMMIAAAVIMAVSITGALWAGYQIGQRDMAFSVHAAADSIASNQALNERAASQALHELLVSQRTELKKTQGRTQDHLDALAMRLGQMQSHILRLNALGEHLADLGGLDAAEFDFSETPPQGGADSSGSAESIGIDELVAEMSILSQTLKDREHKLGLMEGLLFDQQVNGELRPSGRPVQKGWVSSRYGYRKDPFNGKKVFHRGIDVAGKKNSNVIAVAAGVVTRAGKRSGYGHSVEIQHANGYSTLYGHNSKLFVKAGDLVSKGQVIGLMGSSGRSTGPHVHFEIAKNGKSLNPDKYIRRK